jgi:HD-GYP domain-containing protein (c-di-GMP phosphodiesterase class II)
MEKRRRAERLIATLRWLVIMLGLVTAADTMSRALIASVLGCVAVYNGILVYCLHDPTRFAAWGRKAAIASRGLDTVVISIAVVCSGSSSSLAYLLYWFVLVSFGFTCSNLRKLALVGAGVLGADAVATFLGFYSTTSPLFALAAVATRSGVVIFGLLVSLYIAKSRSREDLASERGSYLQAILDCGARLTSFRSVHELALYVLESAVNETGTAGGELLLVNDENHKLECEAFYNAGAGTGQAAPPDSQLRSYANWVMGSRREFLVRTGGKPGEDEASAKDDRAAIAVPLLGQSAESNSDGDNTVLGVLIVWSYAGEDFADDAVDILRIFAAIAGAAIVNLRLYTGLQQSFLRTLQSLAKGLEARDEYTRGHSDRVTQIACLIAEELDLPPESLDALRNASLLHDIGKIGVPDAILRKAGKLTADEWESMRRHPIVSEEICRPLGLNDEVLFLILHHHERLDGKGYPNALPPGEQPLLQRILVVADSFDAMRSRRPYRDRMPQEELMGELNRSAGRTLDPTVVDAVRRLMDRGDTDIIYEEHDRIVGNTYAPREQREAA